MGSKLFKSTETDLIKCVMFDFGNVLGIFDTPRWFDFIYRYRGNCLEPHELFSGSLLGITKDFDLGGLSPMDYYAKVRSAYRISTPTPKDFFNMLGSILSVDREMLEMVKTLRARGVVTVLVTNMNSFHAGYILQHYPEVMVSFDRKMISYEEGVIKPSPEFWIRPLDSLGFNASESIVVDDVLENIRVVCELGMKGWHYNVSDEKFCQNGRLEEERLKFKNFLEYLDSIGLLYDKTRT
ncbi:MAG: HAD-IA family hydrolase [bacterium]|nr:HAD-IA family hydrolase [bacterium]